MAESLHDIKKQIRNKMSFKKSVDSSFKTIDAQVRPWKISQKLKGISSQEGSPTNDMLDLEVQKLNSNQSAYRDDIRKQLLNTQSVRNTDEILHTEMTPVIRKEIFVSDEAKNIADETKKEEEEEEEAQH